jgi:hypothetical protein|tara:strand:- start:509 stop:715 length:207 start_codon:yes stop_codon:yes gene_type:complete
VEQINPIEYGRLLAKVETLEDRVDDMSKDIKSLLELANQSKGGFWMGMTVASIIGGFLTWMLTHWVVR